MTRTEYSSSQMKRLYGIVNLTQAETDVASQGDESSFVIRLVNDRCVDVSL